MSDEYRNALPEGTVIDTYQIVRVLGVGGFGITYLVRELNLDKLFAIKELLPDGIAMRRTGDTSYVEAKSRSAEDDFEATRKYFISEARILAKMNHPAVVSVQRLMEANGTCYMVMDYVEGDTLGDYLKKRGGKFQSKAEFEQIFYPLMDGLEVLHGQEIIHRDIKPGNIMVQPDGSPVLLDFGAATQTQSKTMTITQMLSAGYSPFEQYTSRAHQGPYTDIYALGATMVKCITGEKPDDASDRVYGDTYQQLVENETYVSAYGMPLLAAVDEALKMDYKERPETVAGWRRMMDTELLEQLGQLAVEGRSEVGEPQSQALEGFNGVKGRQGKQKHSQGRWWVSAAVILLLVGLTVVMLAREQASNAEAEQQRARDASVERERVERKVERDAAKLFRKSADQPQTAKRWLQKTYENNDPDAKMAAKELWAERKK